MFPHSTQLPARVECIYVYVYSTTGSLSEGGYPLLEALKFSGQSLVQGPLSHALIMQAAQRRGRGSIVFS